MLIFSSSPSFSRMEKEGRKVGGADKVRDGLWGEGGRQKEDGLWRESGK